MSKRSASKISTDGGAFDDDVPILTSQEWDIIGPFVQNLPERALNFDETTRLKNNLFNNGVSDMRCQSVVSYVSGCCVSRA